MLKRITRPFAALATTSAPAPRARLGVESLEDRAVPAAWTAATVSELIQHIDDANALPGADTITLVPGATYTLTAVNNTTHGPTGLPVAADGAGLTIVGNGATIERGTAAGTPAFRLLDVAIEGALSLQNLTLQGGQIVVGFGVAPAQGGAVYNQGALALDGVTVQNCTAQGTTPPLGGWGGWFNYGGDALGGGVYSNGSLTMTGCTVQNNVALGGRGGAAYVPNSTELGSLSYVRGGRGGSAFGGGVYIGGGAATVTGSAFLGNTARGGDGGPEAPKSNVYVGGHGGDGGDGHGGGVYVGGGAVTMRQSSAQLNAATGGATGSTTGGKGATKGQGIGGGLYLAPADGVFLDAFTADHVKRNKASTGSNDIFGTYTVI